MYLYTLKFFLYYMYKKYASNSTFCAGDDSFHNLIIHFEFYLDSLMSYWIIRHNGIDATYRETRQWCTPGQALDGHKNVRTRGAESSGTSTSEDEAIVHVAVVHARAGCEYIYGPLSLVREEIARYYAKKQIENIEQKFFRKLCSLWEHRMWNVNLINLHNFHWRCAIGWIFDSTASVRIYE